jgi:MFS family permease
MSKSEIVSKHTPLYHLGFYAEDAKAFAQQHHDLYGSGPFIVMENVPSTVNFHGKDVTTNITVATGWWKDMAIEIIQQNSDNPSYLNENGRIMAKTGTARETVMVSGGLLRFAVQLAMLLIVVMHASTVPIYAVYIIMFVGGFYSAVGGVTPAVAPQVQLREEVRPLGNSIIQLGANFGSAVGICIFTAVIAAVGLEQGFKILLIITSFISICDFIFAIPLKKLPEFEAIAEAKKADKLAKKEGKKEELQA